MGYATYEDVSKRLTDRGYVYVADRDNDGTVGAAEQTKYIDTALSYAEALIDEALMRYINLDYARDAGNEWLRDRAVDIATYRASTHGGRKALKTIRDDFDLAMKLLEGLKEGGRVPGLVYPTLSRSASPRVINVGSGIEARAVDIIRLFRRG